MYRLQSSSSNKAIQLVHLQEVCIATLVIPATFSEQAEILHFKEKLFLTLLVYKIMKIVTNLCCCCQPQLFT